MSNYYNPNQHYRRKKAKAKEPPSMLDGLLKQQQREVKKRTEPKESKPRAPRVATTWRCAGCGELFTTETGPKSYAAHADRLGAGHRRIECVMDDTVTPGQTPR